MDPCSGVSSTGCAAAAGGSGRGEPLVVTALLKLGGCRVAQSGAEV